MKELHNLNVLFVEDDEDTQKELLPILQKYFKNIDIAYNGEEGLKKAKKKDYHIIITDIVMPEMDGIKMIKKIKSKTPSTKFIVTTAYSNKEFLINLIELGVHGLLIKPITFRQIANVIQKVTSEIYREKELQHHIKEVERLSKIKSEFLANMSHEIRTPLNAILGFIKVMKDEDDGKFHKYLDIIDSSSQTLLTIINDILDLSKLEAGKMKIEYINFKTEDLYTAIELFEERAKEKNIDYKVKFINIPEYFYGDIHRIKQVITNLISNAIKFTNENKKIEITLEYKNDKLYVEVKDEGIGIPQEKIDNIFEPFAQADSSTTRKYGGTGLGLTISYKLVKMMKGKISVESKLHEGSRFFFEIPIKEGSSIDYKIKIDDDIKKDLKILIAEDNRANQEFMKVILKKLKIDFDIASNGEEAVKLAKTNHYDFILMDINMPIMGGEEATSKIREFSDIPIIALTASALDGDKEKFLKAGMNDYLAKPLDIEKLKNIIRKYE